MLRYYLWHVASNGALCMLRGDWCRFSAPCHPRRPRAVSSSLTCAKYPHQSPLRVTGARGWRLPQWLDDYTACQSGLVWHSAKRHQGVADGHSSLSDFGKHRLQFDLSGAFFTVFLTNSWAIGLQIRQKLPSLGPNFASMPKARQAARPSRGTAA